jgi:hypothetical protein
MGWRGWNATVRLVAAFAVMLALGTFAWRMWPAHIAASEDRNHTRIECVLAGGDTGPAPGPFTGGNPPCAFAERWIFGSVPDAATMAAVVGVVAYLALTGVVLGTRAMQRSARPISR